MQTLHFPLLLAIAAATGASCSHVNPTYGPDGCLKTGDETSITAMLKGPGDKAILCAGSTFSLNGSVSFTADNQQILTDGLPTDSTRAVLRVGSSASRAAVVIQGNNHSGIQLRNLIIDGNVSTYGKASGAGALIQIGGDASSQVVDHVKAYGPRGWSHMHIYEGVGRRCSSATITNNEIGPADKSGLTDGISLACPNSTVSNNTITDATDGGIVIFQAPGSTISDNTIVEQMNVLQSGIIMVDYDPFAGNFAGTVVTRNTVNAAGSRIIIGIAMGPHVWNSPWCSWTQVNTGGTVTDNVLTGPYLGYGIAADGVSNWTVTGNTSTATYKGTPALSCSNTAPIRAWPAAFVRNPSTATGTFQAEFVSSSALENLVSMNRSIATDISPNQTALASGTTSLTLSWPSTAGASYYVRAKDAMDSSARAPQNNCANNDNNWYLCVDNASATSATMSVVGGHLYSWGYAAVVNNAVVGSENGGFYVNP